jgi:myo-inositol 2-dehydrogenase/D-chiro-inositol 1-dehydrogenase
VGLLLAQNGAAAAPWRNATGIAAQQLRGRTVAGQRHRLALIGAGWISGAHLQALDRLGRTELVGVAAQTAESARAAAGPTGAVVYTDAEALLDGERPDIAYVAVPPHATVGVCQLLVDRSIPFLTEKPIAADDDEGVERLATRIAAAGLVVAVGYHLRSLDTIPEVRRRLAESPAQVVTARWLDSTPPRAWWIRGASGGGQVVEQSSHLYDLARLLVGEASVLAAASTRTDPQVPEDSDVADATAAVLRFESGAIGSFVNTRRLASSVVSIELSSPGLLTRIERGPGGPGDFQVTFEDDGSTLTLPRGRDPYEAQAERFLDAVEAGDPTAVSSSYADAVKTYRLTRAVVAATGEPA